MATKIINVLKDDKFEEVLDLFQKTPAGEVIFVLPKRSRAFGDENNFVILAAEAKRHNKNVLMLTSNPEINDLAMKYDFGVLAAKKSYNDDKPKQVEVKLTANAIDDLDDGEEDIGDDGDEENESEDDDENENENEDDKFSQQQKDDSSMSEEPEELKDNEENQEEIPKEKPVEGSEEIEESQESEPAESDPVFYDNSDDQPYNIELAMASRMTKPIADIIKPSEEEGVSVTINKKSEPTAKIAVKNLRDQRRINRETADEISDIWGSRRDAIFNFQKKRKKSNILDGFQLGTPKLWLSFLPKKIVTIISILAILILATVVYITVGSADIIIKPKASPVDLNLKISSSDKFLSVNLNLRSVPGQLFSLDKKIEEIFSATGERDVAQKAKGKITVYNEYGTSPQTLIATTRFQNESGLIFRTLKTITIPGTKVENGKIIPGSVEVEVIADKAGDMYNIESARFNIPAFQERDDFNRYGKFYGISNGPMKGGIIGKAKVITEQDYVNAKKKVEERIAREISDELKNQSAGLKILKLPNPEIKEIVSTAQVDEAADSFTVAGTAELKIVGFKEADLYDLIVRYIEEADNRLVFPEKLKIEFKDAVFNKDSKILEFKITAKGSAYDKINEQEIINNLMGKKENDIKNYIKSIESISSAKIILSPFWVRKVPMNKDKIKLELQYD